MTSSSKNGRMDGKLAGPWELIHDDLRIAPLIAISAMSIAYIVVRVMESRIDVFAATEALEGLRELTPMF